VNNKPDTPLGHLTEKIIAAIQEHIKPDGAIGDVVAHKDRAFQKVFGVLVAYTMRGDLEVRS
jgi:hypothetical protein